MQIRSIFRSQRTELYSKIASTQSYSKAKNYSNRVENKIPPAPFHVRHHSSVPISNSNQKMNND
uniref:Uncharacterized protein n=1 Tax=Cucumis melo TaxID=3656 RepID=A0A9I9EFX7_CUCME